MKKLIHEASDTEIRDYAVNVKQVDIAGCDTRAKLMAALGPVMEDEFITVPDEEKIVQLGQTAPVKPNIPTSERVVGGFDYGPIVYLKIMETEGVGGKHPATPSVNGREIPVSRSVLVGIPYSHYEVLAHSYNGSPSQADADGDSPKPIEYTHVTNYPLSEVRMPPQDEIDAWLTETGKRELGARMAA